MWKADPHALYAGLRNHHHEVFYLIGNDRFKTGPLEIAFSSGATAYLLSRVLAGQPDDDIVRGWRPGQRSCLMIRKKISQFRKAAKQQLLVEFPELRSEVTNRSIDAAGF